VRETQPLHYGAQPPQKPLRIDQDRRQWSGRHIPGHGHKRLYGRLDGQEIEGACRRRPIVATMTVDSAESFKFCAKKEC
jgi:hypothetical protein